jgi:eukaryotic-like serine/threonine-protein kinase
MTEPVPFKYRAFISYSHADAAQAKWLHRALESFAIDKDLVGRETATGTIPKALRPIFRDRDDFTAGHTLSDQTLAALDASAALIVICSPSATKSAYVNEEVRLFKSRHPVRPVVPLIAAGTPGDAELECFPPALTHRLDAEGQVTGDPIEVLAADAREEGDGKSLALAKVVAGLLGVSSDDIFRRAVRERRRRQRSWIAGLSAAAILFAGLALVAEIMREYAVVQEKTAEDRRQDAERERDNANTNYVLAYEGARSFIYDIALTLRDQEGMRAETVRKILGDAEKVMEKLAPPNSQFVEMQQLKVTMLVEFATTYATQGDIANQEESARKALANARPLAEASPWDGSAQHGLIAANIAVGDALMAQGKLVEAKQAYEDALAAADRLAANNEDGDGWRRRDLAVAREKIGDVHKAQGDLAGALARYRDSLSIVETLAKAAPDRAVWQTDLARAYAKIGDMLLAQGNRPDALRYYRDTLAVVERSAEAEPSNTASRNNVAAALWRVIDVEISQDDFAAGLADLERARDIMERLVKADPGNTTWQHDLYAMLWRTADVEQAQGKYDSGLAHLAKGQDIIERLAKTHPANAGWQRDLAGSFMKAGDIFAAEHNHEKAMSSYLDCLAITERLAASDPTNAVWQHDLVLSDSRVAILMAEQGDVAVALTKLRSARTSLAQLSSQSPGDATLAKDLASIEAEIARLEKSDAPSNESQPGQAAR